MRFLPCLTVLAAVLLLPSVAGAASPFVLGVQDDNVLEGRSAQMSAAMNESPAPTVSVTVVVTGGMDARASPLARRAPSAPSVIPATAAPDSSSRSSTASGVAPG